ncbi:hypothetical protein OG239_42485 (plasmid) [Streptomyces sp. NBC_00868]|uniref:hypothetical protein n=1 Tax=Streptomyces sp. NBC_00868 TaxID=2903683 RepID=UPI002F907F38|nr:hypothetical protein OG239_42485 [Streptomyces sp. NBC_00868]
MDVEKRLHVAADSLKREATAFDEKLFMAKIFGALDIVTSGGGDTGPRVDRVTAVHPGPGGPQEDAQSEAPPDLLRFRAELNSLKTYVSEGGDNQEGGDNPRKLRRIAELVELLDGEQAALPWWQRAAEEGDELAIMTVEDMTAATK